MATAMGAATTPNAMRLVSSELKRRSDFHDLGFFRLDQFVDFLDVVVMCLLQILLGVLDVVFGHAVELLQRVPALGAGVPNGDLAVLGVLEHALLVLLVALFVLLWFWFVVVCVLRVW